MTNIPSLTQLAPERFETPAILKKLMLASRVLAELKGIAETIPNQGILINALGLQEAKDSSAIENIVTTHDEIYQDDLFGDSLINPAVKEVLRYRQALRIGFEVVTDSHLLMQSHILQIHEELIGNTTGIRRTPGVALKNDQTGEVVYTPPQDYDTVVRLLGDLVQFMNEPDAFDADPLIKMALIHHQFESIHPFSDGNGRTGRIINVLYLVKEGLLEVPVLYMSRYIVRTKGQYYRLLQSVREEDAWEEWVLYMLGAVEHTAREAITTVTAIRDELHRMKRQLRDQVRFYSQDLLNNLFMHPYTKIDYLMRDLNISRPTAARYLDELCAGGILRKSKIGKSNYYINHALYAILTGDNMQGSSN